MGRPVLGNALELAGLVDPEAVVHELVGGDLRLVVVQQLRQPQRVRVRSQVVKSIGVEAFKDFHDILDSHAVSAEVDNVHYEHEESQLEEQDEVLDVEGSADEAPAETLVLQLKQSYHLFNMSYSLQF